MNHMKKVILFCLLILTTCYSKIEDKKNQEPVKQPFPSHPWRSKNQNA